MLADFQICVSVLLISACKKVLVTVWRRDFRTSKMEFFVTLVNVCMPLTNVIESSILDVRGTSLLNKIDTRS